MSNEQLSHEHMRELGKRVSAALPSGLAYSIIIWPPGRPDDVAYFSNAHRAQALAAMQNLLGAVRDKGDK